MEIEVVPEDYKFRYTKLEDAPQSHRMAVRAKVLGTPDDEIAIQIGVQVSHLLRIFEHPPIEQHLMDMHHDRRTSMLDTVEKWQSGLEMAVNVVLKSMESSKEHIALKAATEYFDRHPSGQFIKRKAIDIGSGDGVLDSEAIQGLKKNAAKQVGDDTHVRRIEHEPDSPKSDNGATSGGGTERPDTGADTRTRNESDDFE